VFYDIFKGLCDKKDVSPSRACIDMGLSRSLGAKWKNTGANPSYEVLTKMAGYFGVSVDYLLGNEQKEKAPSQNEKNPEDITFDDFSYALLDETKELTKENKDKLLEMAKFFKQQQDKENHNSQD
jgi:transcriptional regulator with XRE-family HTH domain